MALNLADRERAAFLANPRAPAESDPGFRDGWLPSALSSWPRAAGQKQQRTHRPAREAPAQSAVAAHQFRRQRARGRRPAPAPALRPAGDATGPGGVGKTRLALEVAASTLDAYADGVWLVELASVADASLVAQAVAGVLGIREQPGRSYSATLSDVLQSKHLLLVLDNCEHVLEACAVLVAELLAINLARGVADHQSRAAERPR